MSPLNCNAEAFKKLLEHSGYFGPVLDRISWMFDDQNAEQSALLNWIAENITTDNILTESEEMQFAELEARNLVYDEEALKVEVELMNSEYPGIFDPSTSYLSLSSHIDVLNEQSAILEAQLDCDKVCKSILKDVTHQKHVSEIELETAAKTCAKFATELEVNEKELMSTLQQIWQLCDQPTLVMLSQINLNNYLHSVKKISSYADMYMERLQNSLKSTADDVNSRITLNRLTENLYSNGVLLANLQSEVEAWESVFASKDEFTSKLLNLSNYQLEMTQVSGDKVLLKSELESLREVKLPEAQKKYCNLLKTEAEYQKILQVLAEKRQTLQQMELLSTILEDAVARSDLLGYIFSIEAEKISFLREQSHLHTQNLRRIQRRTNKRISHLSGTLQQEQENKTSLKETDPWIKCFTDIMKKMNHLSGDISVEDAMKLFYDLVRNVNIQETSTWDASLARLKDISHKATNEINEAIHLIWRDITAQPVVISPVCYPLYYCQLEFEDANTSLKVVKEYFLSKKKSEMHKTNVLRRLLWIFFLRDPNKVLSTIKSVEAIAFGTKAS